MAMTIVVTRNVQARVSGFLASSMCEIAPGVFTAPRMNPAVRQRVWLVLEDWFEDTRDSSIVMTWPDGSLPGGQEVRTLGVPARTLANHHGIYLARRDSTVEEQRSLTKE